MRFDIPEGFLVTTPLSYRKEADLPRAVAMTPEEGEANRAYETSPEVRGELLSAIRNERNPMKLAALEEAYQSDFGEPSGVKGAQASAQRPAYGLTRDMAAPRRRAREYRPIDEVMAEYAASLPEIGANQPAKKSDRGWFGTLASGAGTTARALGAAIDLRQGDADELRTAGEAARLSTEGDDPALKALKEDLARRKEALGENPGWFDAIKSVAGAAIDNPKGAGLLLAEQLPNSAAVMGAAAAGAKMGSMAGTAVAPGPGTLIGGGIGAVMGMFGANYGIEAGHKGIERAQNGQLTPEDMSDAEREGLVKAGVVTGVDAATFGLGAKLFGAAQRAVDRAGARVLAEAGIDAADKAAVVAATRANPALVTAVQMAEQGAFKAATTLGQRALRGGAGISLETLGEGVGEYWGEGLATGNWDKMESVVEAISSLGQSAIETGTAAALNRTDRPASALDDVPGQDNPEGADRPPPTMPPFDPFAENDGVPNGPVPTGPAQMVGSDADAAGAGRLAPAGPRALEGELLGPEALPSGQRLLEAPPIEGELSRDPTALPRPMLPGPEDGGPTGRQVATARGLLNHSPSASPDLLMRLMRIDKTMAEMLFGQWQRGRADSIAVGPQDATVASQGNGGQVPVSTDALGKAASWVIRNRETGEMVMEAFDRKTVERLNTDKYEAVPVAQHLAEINARQGIQNGQDAGAQTDAQVAAPGAQGAGRELLGSGDVLAPQPDGDRIGAGDGTEVAAPGMRSAVVAGGAGAPGVATKVDIGAHDAATSPLNDHPEPTEAQKAAGNYRKGHVSIQGLPISIENPAGSIRSGKDAGGKPWQTEMQHHYGYIKGTVGRDKDHLDVFLGPQAEAAGTAYVVDQIDPETGKFDEHKIILGANSEAEARAIYQANYQTGWRGLGAITAMPMADFKGWIKGSETKKPLAIPPSTATPRATPADAGVSASVAAESVTPATDGNLISSAGDDRAQLIKATQAKATGKPMSVGVAPGNADPVTVRDGVVYVGEYEALNYETGEPVVVPKGSTREEVAKVLKDTGALTGRQRVYGLGEQSGVVMYSRKREEAAPVAESPLYAAKAIGETVRKFKDQFKGAASLDIRIVGSVSEIQPRFRPSPYAEGVFHDDVGLIYLVADNLLNRDGTPNTRRAFQVLMHESVGHYGLAHMMGGRFSGLLKHVMQVARDSSVVRDIYGPGDRQYATVEAVRLRYPEATDAEVAQEVLARMAESETASVRFGYARAVVRQWLRDMARAFGIDVKVTTAELNDLIAKASGYMRAGRNLEREVGFEPSGLAAASRREGDQGFAETERAYGGRDAFERAKAAGRTKLNYRQWVQVRTPTFKAWFGDWEIAGARPERAAETFAQAREEAKAFQGKPLTNDATGIVATVSRNSLDKMLSGKAVGKSETPAIHSLAVANLDALFARALLGWSKPDSEGDPNIKAIHRFFTPVMVDGRAMLAKMTVKETVQEIRANPLYTVEAVSFEEMENPAAQWVGEIAGADGIDPRTIRSAGLIESMAQRVQEFNPDSVSKMVDPDTREPIKSVIGNAGAFDGADSDIRGPSRGLESRRHVAGDSGRQYSAGQQKTFRNIGREVETPTVMERVAGLWQNIGKKLQQGIADQFAPLKDIGGDAYLLSRMSKGADGALEAMLMYGRVFLNGGIYDVDVKDGGVIEKLLRPLGKEVDDFMWWIAGNRAEQLASEGREHLMTPADIANLKALAGSQLDFDYKLQNGQATRDRATAYRDAQRVMAAFNRSVLDIAEQSGLIDGADRAIWERDFYVPFYREAEEGEKKFPSVKKGLVRQKAFDRLKGGTDKLNHDLLANTLMNWSHMLNAAAKNRAAKAAMDAAERAGVATRVPAGEKGAVYVRDAGKEIHYAVNDPFVLDAVTALEFSGFSGPAMQTMGAFKRWLTIGVTASPTFKIRNLIRDSVSAIGTAELSYNLAENLTKGYKATGRNSQTYASMLAGGGVIRFGTMIEGNRADHVRRLVEKGVDPDTVLDGESKLKAFWKQRVMPLVDAYNEVGDRSENINRAALYEQLRKKGMGHAEASLAARDLLDFSMGGTFAAVRFLTQTVPFANARIQGLYKLGRAAKENPKRMGYVVGAVALASLALLTAYHDDDDWKKREDWDRDTYWWFKVGGVAFRIPKPFEIGAIGTLAERSAELLFDKEMDGQRFGQRLGKMVGDTFAMNPVPQMFKPLIDLYSNKDSFTGRPIESMGMERLRTEDRFTARTSEIAKLIGQAGAMSPVQIDHLIRGYFGWLGATSVKAADEILRLGENNPRPAMQLRDTFLIGNFVETLPTGSSRYVTAMYEQAKEIEEAYASWRNYLKMGDAEKAAEIFEDEKDKISRYRAAQRAKAEMTRINAKVRQVEANESLSSEEKRARLDRLSQQRDRVARSVVGASGLK